MAARHNRAPGGKNKIRSHLKKDSTLVLHILSVLLHSTTAHILIFLDTGDNKIIITLLGSIFPSPLKIISADEYSRQAEADFRNRYKITH